MSSVERLNNRLLWEQRRTHGRDTGPARDPWAMTALRRKWLTQEDWAACCRLAGLIERSQGQSGGAYAEWIDGRYGDPHAAMFDAAQAMRALDGARRAVQIAVDAECYALFVAVFDVPHRPIEAFVRGGHKDRFAKRLRPALDALSAYFDACLADRKTWNARGQEPA